MFSAFSITSGGLVAITPMLSQTFHADVHKHKSPSKSDDDADCGFLSELIISPVLLMTSSRGGDIVVLGGEVSSGFLFKSLGSLLWRIS